MWKKIFLTAALAAAATGAEAIRYTETVPGETGPMTVEVVVEKGVFESLRVLGPSDMELSDREAVKDLVRTKKDARTLGLDPLTGALEPSRELIDAIRDGIAAAKTDAEGERAVFRAGTWHSCLKEAEGEIAQRVSKGSETSHECDGLDRADACRSFGFDPLSGVTEPSDALEEAIAAALAKAKKPAGKS